MDLQFKNCIHTVLDKERICLYLVQDAKVAKGYKGVCQSWRILIFWEQKDQVWNDACYIGDRSQYRFVLQVSELAENFASSANNSSPIVFLVWHPSLQYEVREESNKALIDDLSR